jgi:hypothetical protein
MRYGTRVRLVPVPTGRWGEFARSKRDSSFREHRSEWPILRGEISRVRTIVNCYDHSQ